jgi:hypothetical protein
MLAAMLQAFNKMEKGSLFSSAMGMVLPLISQSAAKGAYSMLYAATSPQLEGAHSWILGHAAHAAMPRPFFTVSRLQH